jgi:hypothetical protein
MRAILKNGEMAVEWASAEKESLTLLEDRSSL